MAEAVDRAIDGVFETVQQGLFERFDDDALAETIAFPEAALSSVNSLIECGRRACLLFAERSCDAAQSGVAVTLFGSAGNDTLMGSSLADLLIGGDRSNLTAGTDSLDGGLGSDTYQRDVQDTLVNSAGKTVVDNLCILLPNWVDQI